MRQNRECGHFLTASRQLACFYPDELRALRCIQTKTALQNPASQPAVHRKGKRHCPDVLPQRAELPEGHVAQISSRNRFPELPPAESPSDTGSDPSWKTHLHLQKNSPGNIKSQLFFIGADAPGAPGTAVVSDVHAQADNVFGFNVADRIMNQAVIGTFFIFQQRVSGFENRF